MISKIFKPRPQKKPFLIKHSWLAYFTNLSPDALLSRHRVQPLVQAGRAKSGVPLNLNDRGAAPIACAMSHVFFASPLISTMGNNQAESPDSISSTMETIAVSVDSSLMMK